MIYFSDLHLKPESEAVCRSVLDAVLSIALDKQQDIALLGDVWHVRYSVPIHLLSMLRQTLHLWVGMGVKVYILPGNHDQIDVAGRHALEVFEDIPGVRVFHSPTFDPDTGVWLPYRKDPRVLAEWAMNWATNSRKDGVVAHLHHGIVGAWMNSGVRAGPLDGLEPGQLAMFPRVYCGHWHRHQVVGQCVYVGSPWQTKADEAGQQKGVVFAKPANGYLTSPDYAFLPFDVGRRHHAVTTFSEAEVRAMRPGDAVRVPSGTAEATVSALRAMGVEVFVAPEHQQQVQRLQTAPGSTLRDMAQQYLLKQTLPGDLTPEELMAVYDEIAGG